MAQTLDNLQVSYTYHEHTGSAGTTANGCYTKATYHSHITSCYKYCNGVLVYQGKGTNNNGVTQGRYKCSVCSYDTGYIGSPYINGEAAGQKCWSSPTLICGKSTSTLEVYSLGCGKTEQTIESAIIIY